MREKTEQNDGRRSFEKTEQEQTTQRKTSKADSEPLQPSDIWKIRITRLFRELICGAVGFLLGSCELLFGTYPLGLGILCATEKHVLAVFFGVVIATVTQVPNPLVSVCVLTVVAFVRAVSGMLIENPNARFRLFFKGQKETQSGAVSQETAANDLLCSTAWQDEKTSEEDLHGASDPTKRSEPVNIGSSKVRQILNTVGGLFTESMVFRMILGAVGAFLISFARTVAGGFQYYDFFAMLFSVLLVPLLTVLLSTSLGTDTKTLTVRIASELFLLFCLVFSASAFPKIGFFTGAGLAFFCVLYWCRERGIVLGCLAAVIAGAAFDTMQIPSFLLSALVFSLLRPKSNRGGSVLVSGLAFLAWSIYARGAILLPSLLPSLLLFGMIFTIWEKWRSSDARSLAETLEQEGQGDPMMVQARCRDSNDRFRGISDAFTSLSEMFYNLSDRFRRPGTLDLRQICDRAFDECCRDCPNKTVCWGVEYSSTLSTVNDLIAQLHTHGKVTKEQFSTSIKRRCNEIGILVEKINQDCSHLTADMLRNNRTEIFAMDYEAAARIINDALEEDAEEYRFDTETEQKVREYLKDAGITVCNVSVYGNRRRQIVLRGVNTDRSKVSMQTLRADLGEMCGLELCRPVLEMDGKVSIVTLQAKRKIAVLSAQNNVSADGGISGDSLNLFSNRQDYFYALISDGMGAGKEAALTSGLCSVFLEKMLRAGNRAWTSLRMLNNLIRSRGAGSVRECSSTIDLLELDLMTANASFIKSGAAPSFIVRDGTVHCLQVGTAPIGIIQALDAQATPFSLRTGDTVVMVSDGILQNDEDCTALTAFLTQVGSLSPEEIVYRICVQAATAPNHDDCSAVALRITDAGEE